MDKMQNYEVDMIIPNLPYSEINLWETARFIVYANAQQWSKKKLSPKDIIEFLWEKQDVEKNTIEISTEDVNRLREKSKLISKSLKNEFTVNH